MTLGEPAPPDVPCVGLIVHDRAGRLLLVRRAHDPDAGRWSLPGGRREPGEDDAAALVREAREETGLHIEPGALVGRVRRGRYVIADYRATVLGGTLQAGDDATDARWCTPTEVDALPLSALLGPTLREWGVLPPTAPPGTSPPTPAAE